MQLSGRPENIKIYPHLRNRQSTECNNYRVARLKFLAQNATYRRHPAIQGALAVIGTPRRILAAWWHVVAIHQAPASIYGPGSLATEPQKVSTDFMT
jgi:hypothetical protein